MKICKKCGTAMRDSRDKLCEECEQKSKKTKKIIGYIVAGVGIAGVVGVAAYAIFKGKAGGKAVRQISDAVKDVVLSPADNSNKVFGGLTQSKLDALVKDTYRGLRVVIQGDALEYFYESASGKTAGSAWIKFDDEGKLVCYLGNGPYYAAKSPRFFFEKLLEAMQEIN